MWIVAADSMSTTKQLEIARGVALVKHSVATKSEWLVTREVRR